MDYPLPNYLVEKAVREALAEDLGLAGDITTDLIIPADARGAAAIVVREPAVSPDSISPRPRSERSIQV